ncbi:MAG: hypothetical protein MRECE_5c051 [Mycoplasmataceae bacterium CE_OT135]|nr:MAG: hypothetical protein MRECE_5c051 [Mycoplasmataceae bacterium CE_OT135]
MIKTENKTVKSTARIVNQSHQPSFCRGQILIFFSKFRKWLSCELEAKQTKLISKGKRTIFLYQLVEKSFFEINKLGKCSLSLLGFLLREQRFIMLIFGILRRWFFWPI